MKVLPLFRQATQRRILVLEDHELLRISMVRTLSELPNVAVTGVTTVRDALTEIDTGEPDLVVSDLELPDGSGLELIRRLRKDQPPIVFVSGQVERYERQLDNYPGIVVLDKPLSGRTLKHIVAGRLDAERVAVAPFSAGDYIQLACLGRHSVRIDLHGPDVEGAIHIKDGRLWAATTGRREGLSALGPLVFTEGSLVTCSGPSLDPGPSNLPDAPWEQVLLGLAKEHDEGAHASAMEEHGLGEMDLSDIFDEAPERAVPAPVAVLPEVPAVRPSQGARFEQLLDDAHDALLRKDYATALRMFERAGSLRPNDSMVKGNLARLLELLGR